MTQINSETSSMLPEKRSMACAQRRLVENDLDEVTAHRRRAEHPHDVGAETVQNKVSNASRTARHHDMSRMSMLWLMAGGISDDGQQPALVAHLHRDRVGADAVENLLGQAFRHHAARRGVEHQRGGMRRRRDGRSARSCGRSATAGT